HLGSKTGWHKSELPIRSEEHHSRTICGFDPPHLLFPYWIDHANVVLSPHGYPQFAAVRPEERLVWGTAHVDLPLHSIRFGVDQHDGIGAYRNNIECSVVGRKAETVDQQFATIQRTEGGRNIFAQADRAK